MRYCWISAFGLLVAPSAAGAQGVDNWSGVYAGADVGGVSARVRAVSTVNVQQVTNIFITGRGIVVVPGTSTSFDRRSTSTNVLYGGTVGFLAQSGNWVFGLEGDGHGSRSSGSLTSTASIPGTILSPASTVISTRDYRTRYDWSLRARTGIALGHTLLYVAGGVTGTKVRVRSVDTYTLPAGTSPGGVAAPALGPIVTTASQARTMTGWTAGIGAERRIASHASIGLDARYDNYGSKDFAGSPTTTSPPLLNYGNNGAAGTPLNPSPVASSTTRISLTDLRLSLRLLFRF